MAQTGFAKRDLTKEPAFGPWLSHASILVIDDEPGMRNFLVKILKPRCRNVAEAANTKEAAEMLDSGHFDVVILDNIMPGQNGVDWLREQRKVGFFADAILITAFADLETAIRALQAGAVDFVLKPFRSNQILNAVARCIDRTRLRRENFLLRHELETDAKESKRGNRLLGKSKPIKTIRETLRRVAPLPSTVLITGESGSGKGVAARTLHALSDRSDKAFVSVNCATIPADLLETELFGHVKGANIDRDDFREGLFLHASGGTLFLDEVADLPLDIQGALLRAIDDKKIRPVGSMREMPIDVRFVFAANRDLHQAVEEGRFRADLLYRINVLQIEMPPLRDRIEDVQELADKFMQEISFELGVAPLKISNAIRRGFLRYDWPGNVRELRNLIERSLILSEFPPDFEGADEDSSFVIDDTLQSVERQHILRVLEECDGNRAKAARRLGVSRKTIDRKCAMWHG
ncbi:MAG: sigma-54 dependent transcriptional regulator [Rhodobacterales bacterium]